MQNIHKDAELAPRDIVARAIFREHQNGNRPAIRYYAAQLDLKLLINFLQFLRHV